MNNIVKKLCICIPTQNRAEMIDDVLQYESEYYPEYDFDVIYYDSSDTDDTQKVIDKYKKKGFKNLFYQRVKSGQCIDYKIIDIWRNNKILLNYKYIWLINDATTVFAEFINELFGYLDDDYDLIRLPREGAKNSEDFITSDQDEWFHKCSESMGYMASTIMNSRLLSGSIDWNSLRDKYVGSNDINDKAHGFFFTVGFYLERILDFNDFKGLLIGGRKKWRRESPLKNGNSYWNDLIFDTWARSYPETILKTPSCYTDKKEIIRISDNIMCGRFERQSLISLRIRGLLTENEFLRFKNFWQYVTTLSEDEIREIACTPRDALIGKYGENYGRADVWSKNLAKIENEVKDREIIIYGAGLYGTYSLEKLIHDGFKEKISGIAVTNKTENADAVMGISVREIAEYDNKKTTAMVIIATLPDTAQKIRKSLIERGYKNIYPLF